MAKTITSEMPSWYDRNRENNAALETVTKHLEDAVVIVQEAQKKYKYRKGEAEDNKLKRDRYKTFLKSFKDRDFEGMRTAIDAFPRGAKSEIDNLNRVRDLAINEQRLNTTKTIYEYNGALTEVSLVENRRALLTTAQKLKEGKSVERTVGDALETFVNDVNEGRYEKAALGFENLNKTDLLNGQVIGTMKSYLSLKQLSPEEALKRDEECRKGVREEIKKDVEFARDNVPAGKLLIVPSHVIAHEYPNRLIVSDSKTNPVVKELGQNIVGTYASMEEYEAAVKASIFLNRTFAGKVSEEQKKVARQALEGIKKDGLTDANRDLIDSLELTKQMKSYMNDCEFMKRGYHEMYHQNGYAKAIADGELKPCGSVCRYDENDGILAAASLAAKTCEEDKYKWSLVKRPVPGQKDKFEYNYVNIYGDNLSKEWFPKAEKFRKDGKATVWTYDGKEMCLDTAGHQLPPREHLFENIMDNISRGGSQMIGSMLGRM